MKILTLFYFIFPTISVAFIKDVPYKDTRICYNIKSNYDESITEIKHISDELKKNDANFLKATDELYKTQTKFIAIKDNLDKFYDKLNDNTNLETQLLSDEVKIESQKKVIKVYNKQSEYLYSKFSKTYQDFSIIDSNKAKIYSHFSEATIKQAKAYNDALTYSCFNNSNADCITSLENMSKAYAEKSKVYDSLSKAKNSLKKINLTFSDSFVDIAIMHTNEKWRKIKFSVDKALSIMKKSSDELKKNDAIYKSQNQQLKKINEDIFKLENDIKRHCNKGDQST